LHVVPLPNARPMLLEHGTAVVVSLDLPEASHSSSLKSKVHSSYTGEQAPKRQLHNPPLSAFSICCSSILSAEAHAPFSAASSSSAARPYALGSSLMLPSNVSTSLAISEPCRPLQA
jgi:hypothetical protein